MYTILKRKLQQGSSHIQTKVRLRIWVGMLWVMMLVLVGCGNKGDLYLPEKEDTKTPASLFGEGPSKS